jgi:hypothetical protein
MAQQLHHAHPRSSLLHRIPLGHQHHHVLRGLQNPAAHGVVLNANQRTGHLHRQPDWSHQLCQSPVVGFVCRSQQLPLVGHQLVAFDVSPASSLVGGDLYVAGVHTLGHVSSVLRRGRHTWC